MGQSHSQPGFASYAKGNGKKGHRKNGSSGKQWTGILHLPLDLQALVQVKTLEAGASTFDRACSGVNNFSQAYTSFQNGRTARREMKANGKAFRESMPAIHTSSNAIGKFFRDKNMLELLTMFLHSIEVVAHVLDIVCGGSELEKIGIKIAGELEAQTGIATPEKFSVHVQKFINFHVNTRHPDQMRHVYFLYHPDVNWYPEFRELVRDNPLPAGLLGMSEDLDALVIWMKFCRLFMNKSKDSKETMFHLIIPAYRTMLIKDPLEFPDVGPLTLHGENANGTNYVWFNLPTLDDYPNGFIRLEKVGNMAREESYWKNVAAAGTVVGGMTTSMAAVIGVCTICPPAAIVAVPLLPAAGMASFCTAISVKRKLSREVPRILGTQDFHHPDESDSDAAEDDRGQQIPEPVIFQPHTRHVSYTKGDPRERRRRRRRSRHGERSSRSRP